MLHLRQTRVSASDIRHTTCLVSQLHTTQYCAVTEFPPSLWTIILLSQNTKDEGSAPWVCPNCWDSISVPSTHHQWVIQLGWLHLGGHRWMWVDEHLTVLEVCVAPFWALAQTQNQREHEFFVCMNSYNLVYPNKARHALQLQLLQPPQLPQLLQSLPVFTWQSRLICIGYLQNRTFSSLIWKLYGGNKSKAVCYFPVMCSNQPWL